MKKKLSLTLISILSVVVLVGVGFAAWIITTPSVNETQTGSITASGVTDARYKLTATIAGESIVFGKPSKMDKQNAWFKADENVGAENLAATLTLTLTAPDGNALSDDVFSNHLPDTFTFTMNATKPVSGEEASVDAKGDDAKGDFDSAVSKNYVKNPTISYGTVSATPVTLGNAIEIKKSAFTKEADNKHTLTITITFAWGTAFTDDTHTNPYNYFNSLEYSATNAEKALELTAMQKKINNISYTITIASKADAQQTT